MGTCIPTGKTRLPMGALTASFTDAGTLAGEALLNEDQAVEICHSLLQRQPTRSIGATSIRSSSAVGGTHALPRASSYHYSWQHVIPKTRPIDPESLVPYIVVVTWIHWARDPFS